MILTCPNCATRYVVEAADLPAAGRLVRCSACSEQWRASPGDSEDHGPAEPEAPAAEGLAVAEAPAADPPSPAPLEPWQEAAAAPREPPVFRPLDLAESQAPAVEPPLVVAPVMAQRRPPRRDPTGPIVAVAGVLLILAIAALIAFPQSVVRLVPAAASSYRALGIPVAAPASPRHG